MEPAVRELPYKLPRGLDAVLKSRRGVGRSSEQTWNDPLDVTRFDLDQAHGDVEVDERPAGRVLPAIEP